MPQPTGPRIRDIYGNTLYDFGPSFRVEGLPKTREIPTIKVAGQDGAIVHPDMMREEPRPIMITGELFSHKGTKAERQADIESQLDIIMEGIGGSDEVWISRSGDDSRYISGYYQNVDHAYIERVERTLAVCTLTFYCHDPYWYALTHTTWEQDVVFTDPITKFEIDNKGSAFVEPIIIITGKEDGGLTTEDPRLINYTTGRDIQYTGYLAAGDQLILDAKKISAIKIGDNIMNSGTAQGGWVDTITLASGASSIDGEYVDHVISIVAGTGSGQSRIIEGYNGSTKGATVNQDWDTTPDDTSDYEIYKLPENTDDYYYVYENQTGYDMGENVVGNMSSDYIIHGFPLVPGINKIEVVDNNDLMKLSILYRERWL